MSATSGSNSATFSHQADHLPMTVIPENYRYADDVLKGRIILVTGATDGIGRELATQCAALGARVILHGRDASCLLYTSDAADE